MSKSIRLILVALTTSVFLLAAGCGGGGGGGGDDGFPTPKLPADAARFDAVNANDIANTAVGFVGTLETLAELKSEESPSLTEAARLATDRVMRNLRTSPSLAARTEDISAGLCINMDGEAFATFEESGSGESGSVTFSACEIGSGIVINGTFSYVASFNATTLAYSFQAGGTLTVAAAGETITIVMNSLESGNDGTGAFSTTVSFSLSGIPDSGFLVTTAQAWTGNVFSAEITDGQLIVHGSDNTRIRITVTGPNAADVDLDNGSGTFVFDSTILF